MKRRNQRFKLYTSIITVLLVAVSTAQLSSVVPSDHNVVYAYSNNSQAQSLNKECEYDDSSGFNCVFNGPVIIGNDTAVITPPSQTSAPQGPPGSPGDDPSQTIVTPHDEYETKKQEVLKNALKD
jgi:hypothetical protein